MVTVAHASLVELRSEVENGEGLSREAALYATLCKEGFPAHLVGMVPYLTLAFNSHHCFSGDTKTMENITKHYRYQTGSGESLYETDCNLVWDRSFN